MIEPYFDVALSFAGEDRKIAESLACGLRENSLRVFYDMFYQADLVGEDLARLLARIYCRASRFCIPIISKHYARKSWPRFELSQAQERSIFGDSSYLIPVQIDSTRVSGIPATVGHIDLRVCSIDKAIQLITKKVMQAKVGKPGLGDLL